MNATSNPQTAAEQARKNYRDVMIPDTSVPEAVRAMAEKTVAQTREVYDRSKDAFDASIATFERTFDAAGQGAVAFNRKIIDIAQRNVNSGFDLAKSLAGAKNLAEMVELQAAYWQKLVRRAHVPSRRSSRALDQDGSRRGRTSQGTGETRRGSAAQGKLKACAAMERWKYATGQC